jgi:hypothetical protein
MVEVNNTHVDEYIEPSCENTYEECGETVENADVDLHEDLGEEQFDPAEDGIVEESIVDEQQHDHTPSEITVADGEEYEGYNHGDESFEENNNELDEEAINSFITQLFELKRNNL